MLSISVIDVNNDIRPLLDRELLRINRNLNRLIQLLDCSDLLDHLWAEKCISSRQRQDIRDESKASARNELLLDIFTKRNYRDFVKLIHWLNELGQPHVAKMLTQDGGILHC